MIWELDWSEIGGVCQSCLEGSHSSDSVLRGSAAYDDAFVLVDS